jgi:phosphomannomutase
VDLTDGLRVTFANDTVIHLRPSGNAPEFRCYAEAGSANEAETLMRETLKAVAAQLRNSA